MILAPDGTEILTEEGYAEKLAAFVYAEGHRKRLPMKEYPKPRGPWVDRVWTCIHAGMSKAETARKLRLSKARVTQITQEWPNG